MNQFMMMSSGSGDAGDRITLSTPSENNEWREGRWLSISMIPEESARSFGLSMPRVAFIQAYVDVDLNIIFGFAEL
jgi:hypothetical protein